MGSGSGTGSTGGVFHRSLLIHFINRVSAFSAALSEALAQSRWRGWDPIGALRCVRNRRALCGDVSMETAGSVVMGRERGGLYPELLMHGYTRRLFLQHVPWSHLKGTYQEKSNFPWSFQIQGFCALTVDITFKIPVHPETYTLKTVWLFEFDVKKWGEIHRGGLYSDRSFWNQVGIQQIVIPNWNCHWSTNTYIRVRWHKSLRRLRSVVS